MSLDKIDSEVLGKISNKFFVIAISSNINIKHILNFDKFFTIPQAYFCNTDRSVFPYPTIFEINSSHKNKIRKNPSRFYYLVYIPMARIPFPNSNPPEDGFNIANSHQDICLNIYGNYDFIDRFLTNTVIIENRTISELTNNSIDN